LTPRLDVGDIDGVDRREKLGFYVRFGQAVRDARLARGLTQTDVGDALSLTRASVANIEAGRQQCSLHTAAVLAQVVRVPLHDLLPDDHDDVTPENDRILGSVPPRVRADVALVLNRGRHLAELADRG
jgi:DNA-binding XRE family transcriptional regulator